jgi:hypothetical protein
MKPVLSLMLCLTWFCSPGQYSYDSATNRDIRLLLEKFTAGTMDSSDRKQITQLTYAIQNKGFYYSEYYKAEYDSSLIEIDRALLVWTTLRDTANVANLRKFRGYLLGKLKKFEAGKKEVRESIRLYTLINRPAGVAVAQYDLSYICVLASQPDSALYFGRRSYQYFLQRNETLRIVIYGNHLLQAYGSLKRYKEALQIQKQTQAALDRDTEVWPKHNLKHLADFNYLSGILYRKLGQNVEAKKYREKHENFLGLFKIEGVNYILGYHGF